MKQLGRTMNIQLANLLSEWKQLFNPKHLGDDILAGIIVACVAIPLSLAIALASGVSPAVGLTTSVVTGIVCALFGGTPLAVSGPAAAMAVLVAVTAEKHGVSGLIIVTIVAGILQFCTGLFGLGKWIRLIPVSVVAGFTAGIGAIILIGQYPRALGLPAPDPSHVCDVFTHALEIVSQTNPKALLLALSTLVLTFLVPKLSKKIPAALIAVAIPSAFAFLTSWNVEKIGVIPSSLPLPAIPSIPMSGLAGILASGFMVFALASLETLLSSSAVDKVARGKRHDPNQELIGQGLGNFFSGLFGGIPATGVIARSALNVQVGAKTRRAAIIHSLVILLAVFFFAPIVGEIPIAVLAGMLMSVAIRMLNPKEFFQLWALSKPDVIVYVVTFITIVSVDLIAGVEAGLAAALVIVAVRLGQSNISLTVSTESNAPHRISLSGPVTFLSSGKLDELGKQLSQTDLKRGVIFDLSRTDSLDATGVESLAELVSVLSEQDGKIALLVPSQEFRKQLLQHDATKVLAERLAETESETADVLQMGAGLRAIHRLRHGVENYRNYKGRYKSLFERLANGQQPHTLFITCSDSRIDPSLITSTNPGELLIVRNVGNIVPPYINGAGLSEAAAIEFAVEKLGVSEIVICGHSGCGAIQAAFTPKLEEVLPDIAHWLSRSDVCFQTMSSENSLDSVARKNVLHQIEHLKTYPSLRKKLAEGSLGLHGWFFDISKSDIEELSISTSVPSLASQQSSEIPLVNGEVPL